MTTHTSSDDESAEMDRVRTRLRQQQSLRNENDMSLAESSDSSIVSQASKAWDPHKVPSDACITSKPNPSSEDQQRTSTLQPLTVEKPQWQEQSALKNIDDDKVSIPEELSTIGYQKQLSSGIPTDPAPCDSSDLDDYFCFLEDDEALDELDRQIEASLQAKDAMSPVPHEVTAAAECRLRECLLQTNTGDTQLLESIDDNSLLDAKEVPYGLDREVEVTTKTSQPSNKTLFKQPTVEQLKPHQKSRSKSCHSSDTDSLDRDVKGSLLKPSRYPVYTKSARGCYDDSDSSEPETDLERSQRLATKRKRKHRKKTISNSGTSKKKRKELPRSMPKQQRQVERVHALEKNVHSVPKIHPLSHGPHAGTVAEVDGSSDDSFGFFNEDEINRIEERVRSEQRKRSSLENGDTLQVPSSSKAETKLIQANSADQFAYQGSQSKAFGVAMSQPQLNSIDRTVHRDESNFDHAFGFQEVAHILEYSKSQAKDDVGTSNENTTLCSLEKQQHHNQSSFDSIETDERMSEIDPILYAPKPPKKMHPPIVHRFSLANRPLASRRRVHVENVFPQPISFLWRTKFPAFNQMQSELANVVAYSDDNIVVSAPTGAGKTALFEMAMARFFTLNLQRQIRKLDERQQIDKSQKIVYVSPSKALCDERYEDWTTRLGTMNLGIQLALVTGDGDPSASYKDLANANVVLTTPEKWDSLTRRWTENFFLFASVKLFLVDEVHLVADDSRGWCLESIICRMKTIQNAAQRISVTQTELQHSSYSNTTPEAINAAMRTVAVSATLPNLEDIASFVEANEAHSFDESYRPVPLTVHVIGQGYVGDSSANQFRFWSGLDRNIPDLIHRFSQTKPSLVFCHSKADTEKLTELLAVERGIGCRSDMNSHLAGQTKDTRLQKALFYGLAYHHAGLEAEDRHLVEKCFAEGKIRVLCATSTLAMGVNLPAHLVIIKGTKAWRGGGRGYSDLDQATLLQMIGRAGRPGFDSTGTAIIMTDNRSKGTFERLASQGLDPAVSKLCTKLDEIVNAEVSQNVISSTESAFNWITSTLFCAQLLRQPTLFRKADISAENSDEYLRRICNDSLQRLEAFGALSFTGGKQVFALPASHVMSHNLVDYHTMEQFVDIPNDASQYAVLLSLSQIDGMHRPVRRSEKKALKLMHGQLKYKLEGPLSKATIRQPFEKVFVLLQASMMRLAIEDHTLRKEMNMIVEFSSRMLTALEEFSVRSSRNGIVALQSIRLRRALLTNGWVPHEGLLHQLAGVDPATAINLKRVGICSFDDVLKRSSEQIEKAAGRASHFGNRLKNTVQEVLRGMLTMNVYFEDDIPGAALKTVVCVIDRQAKTSTNQSEVKSSSKELSYTLIAYCDRSGKCILYRRNVSSSMTCRATTSVDSQKVIFHLIAPAAGLDVIKELDFFGKKEIQHGDDSAVLQRRPQNIKTTKPNARDSAKTSLCQSEGHWPINEKCTPEQQTLAFVTPSPKLLSDTTASKMASKNNESLQVKRPARQLVSDTADAGSVSPFLTRQSNPSSNSVRNVLSIVRDDFHSGFWDNNPSNDDTSNETIAPSDYSVRPSSKNLVFQENKKTPNQGGFRNAWKREKLQQHKTQQRAFVRKEDNPFSDFKCDPNNAENALDSLSSVKPPAINQVIPAEGFKALESAYSGNSSPYQGSQLTIHSRPGLTNQNRARRGTMLQDLPTNGREMRQVTQWGLSTGDSTPCSSAAINGQMEAYSRLYQPHENISQMDHRWHGQVEGHYHHFGFHPGNPYTVHANYPQCPTFHGNYRTFEEYREDPAGVAQHLSAENSYSGPRNSRGGSSVNTYEAFQYNHGWG